MRYRPIPPAAYAAATAVLYTAVGVGVFNDIAVHPLTIPAGIMLAGCVYALVSLVRGRAGEEAVSDVVVVYCMCVDFSLAPAPDRLWAVWTYSIFVGIIMMLLIRCWWLCKRL